MKNLSIVLLFSFLMGCMTMYAQQGERPKGGGKERQAQGKERPQGMDRSQMGPAAPGGAYCLIKATEQSIGKYTLQMDFGIEKEGPQKNVFQNEKEKEALEKAMKESSLIDLLNLLAIKGFEVINSYAVNDSKLTTHYFLLQQSRKGGPQRTGLKPEDIEKRKKE